MSFIQAGFECVCERERERERRDVQIDCGAVDRSCRWLGEVGRGSKVAKVTVKIWEKAFLLSPHPPPPLFLFLLSLSLSLSLSVSLYFPRAWLAPTFLAGSSWEPDFCGIEIWRGKRDGAGGTRKGRQGREEVAAAVVVVVGVGNWSTANATLLLRSGGNFRLERPGLSTIQTPGLES